MNEREQVAEVLEAAADRLDECGWTQGAYRNNWTGGMCAAGALDMAACGMERQVGRAAHLALFRSLGGNTGVATWNDRPERTKEDVTTAMRKAAITVREKVE